MKTVPRHEALIVIFFEFFAAVLLCILFFLQGHTSGLEQMRATAIQHDAAAWRLDPKTGERAFYWKDEK